MILTSSFFTPHSSLFYPLSLFITKISTGTGHDFGDSGPQHRRRSLHHLRFRREATEACSSSSSFPFPAWPNHLR